MSPEINETPNQNSIPPADDSAKNEIPRRVQLEKMTSAERAIRVAVFEVESIHGADPLLTDATNLLQQAQEKVADYVDGKRTP